MTASVDAPPGPKPVPRIDWAPDPRTERRLVIKYVTATPGNFIIHWGDHDNELIVANAAYTHVYAEPGAYMLTMQEPGPGQVLMTQQVFVRDGLEPRVTWGPNPQNPNSWQCRFEDDATGLVSKMDILWPEAGGPDRTQLAWGVPGTLVERILPTGDHEIRIRDLHTGRFKRAIHTIVGKQYDPNFTLAEETDPSRRKVGLTFTVVTAKPVTIDWGDGAEPEQVAEPAIGQKLTHLYPEAGTYFIEVKYADGSTDGKGDTVTVPYADTAALPEPAALRGPDVEQP